MSATTDVTVSRRTVSGRLEVSAGYGAMVLIGLYEETDEDSAAVLRHAIDTGVTSSLPRTPKDPTASPSGWSGGAVAGRPLRRNGLTGLRDVPSRRRGIR